MKYLFTASFWFSLFYSFGTPVSPKEIKSDTLTVGQLRESQASVVMIKNDTITNCNYYLIAGQNKPIPIYEEENCWFAFDTCDISAIQIDGKGSKEIIIRWKVIRWNTIPGEHGSAYEWSKTQIWNVDTRQKLFDASDNYRTSSYSILNAETIRKEREMRDTITNTEPEMVSEECSYKYDLDISDQGVITISHIQKNFSNPECENFYIGEKYQEGIYILKNGIYEKK